MIIMGHQSKGLVGHKNDDDGYVVWRLDRLSFRDWVSWQVKSR